MINYETNTSAFFVANKAFCEKIESRLNSFNYTYSGFCNSYGYEIVSNFKKNEHSYNLKYIKHQTTQDGVIIPVNALDYVGVELSIEGFDKKNEISFGKNKIRRIFSEQKFKSLFPTPFYVSTYSTDKSVTDPLFEILLDNKISSFTLKDGKAEIKIHSASTDIFDLIAKLEEIL